MPQAVLALWNLIVLDDPGQATYAISVCFPPGKTGIVIMVRVKGSDTCECANHGTVHGEGTSSTFFRYSNKGIHNKELKFFIPLSL